MPYVHEHAEADDEVNDPDGHDTGFVISGLIVIPGLIVKSGLEDVQSVPAELSV